MNVNTDLVKGDDLFLYVYSAGTIFKLNGNVGGYHIVTYTDSVIEPE